MTRAAGGVPPDAAVQPAAASVEAVTVQFHPDWPHHTSMVIESMVADRRYQSQFATGISNGGLTAYVGGDRWRWESRLFCGSYDAGPDSERPVYGAWNRRADPYGGAVRCGSSYVRLHPRAGTRVTFCFPDSAGDPEAVGDVELLPTLCRMADDSTLDDLDDYVEAHVHGAVRFDTEDVDALVLEPSFIGTAIVEAAGRLGCRIEFHPGFRASPVDFDHQYRGTHIVDLARSLGEHLTPESSAGPRELDSSPLRRSNTSGTAWRVTVG